MRAVAPAEREIAGGARRRGEQPLGDRLGQRIEHGLRDALADLGGAARNRPWVLGMQEGAGRILDVHKVHLALGRLGSQAAIAWLEENAPECLPADAKSGTADSPYAHQTSDETTKFLKQLFNWRLTAEEREGALDGLLDHAFADSPPRWQDFYLDERGLRALSDAGMGVGPHSHSHEVSIRLSPERQLEEVRLSCDFVEENGGSRRWGYCYPFGLRSAFSQETERAVADAGCPFAFAFEARDIETTLEEAKRYALPRHNCNAFPHGAASYGA